MDNGRIFSYERIDGVTLTGFIVHLKDPNHALMPICSLMRYMDDEERLSTDIKFSLGNIPDGTIWGKVGRSLKIRAYAVGKPFWRKTHEWDRKAAEEVARDKIQMRDNTHACLPENHDLVWRLVW